MVSDGWHPHTVWQTRCLEEYEEYEIVLNDFCQLADLDISVFEKFASESKPERIEIDDLIPRGDSDEPWKISDQILFGGDVVATFMRDELEIGEIGFEWVGSHHLKRFYREDGLIQISLNENKEERSQKVLTALKELRTRRRRRFRVCKYCKKKTPPEHGGSTCHNCMSIHEGIVF